MQIEDYLQLIQDVLQYGLLPSRYTRARWSMVGEKTLGPKQGHLLKALHATYICRRGPVQQPPLRMVTSSTSRMLTYTLTVVLSSLCRTSPSSPSCPNLHASKSS